MINRKMNIKKLSLIALFPILNFSLDILPQYSFPQYNFIQYSFPQYNLPSKDFHYKEPKTKTNAIKIIKHFRSRFRSRKKIIIVNSYINNNSKGRNSLTSTPKRHHKVIFIR
jgi:hypothetical protein